MTNFTEMLKMPSDGLKNIVDIWIRSCHHKKVSVKDTRTILLLESLVEDQSRDQ